MADGRAKARQSVRQLGLDNADSIVMLVHTVVGRKLL